MDLSEKVESCPKKDKNGTMLQVHRIIAFRMMDRDTLLIDHISETPSPCYRADTFVVFSAIFSETNKQTKETNKQTKDELIVESR